MLGLDPRLYASYALVHLDLSSVSSGMNKGDPCFKRRIIVRTGEMGSWSTQQCPAAWRL